MNNSQAGQTLIETVVAIFIMVMGITSALGLAIYSLNASRNVSNQIIAVGLAREGIEAIKNMRDTNWLRDTLSSGGCYDYVTGSNIGQSCYANWLDPVGGNGTSYDIEPPSATKNYTISYDLASELMWVLSPPINDNKVSNFALAYDVNASNGLYFPNTSGTSDYYRKITIEKSSNYAPYDINASGTNEYPLLKVTSRVWWKGKGCPVRAPGDNAPDESTTDQRCIVILETYLTNWKTY
jgi:type II secretory pathway pseudopilin PulG